MFGSKKHVAKQIGWFGILALSVVAVNAAVPRLAPSPKDSPQGRIKFYPGANHGPKKTAGPCVAAPAAVRQDRVKNGNYGATVSGFYHGTGNASVAKDTVSILADITNDNGQTGKLVAQNLTVSGPYFFGPGKMSGHDVYITGRVDAARASRLIANFSTDDGRDGRVVAVPPPAVDPGDDHWNDAGQ